MHRLAPSPVGHPRVEVLEPGEHADDEVDPVLVALDHLEDVVAHDIRGRMLAVPEPHLQPPQTGVGDEDAVDQRPHRSLDGEAAARGRADQDGRHPERQG